MTQVITTVAGGGSGFQNGQPATSVSLIPISVHVAAQGDLYLTDYGYPIAIRKVTAATGLIATIAGSDSPPGTLGDNGPATAATLYYPRGVYVDKAGNLFIADTGNNRVRAVRGPVN